MKSIYTVFIILGSGLGGLLAGVFGGDLVGISSKAKADSAYEMCIPVGTAVEAGLLTQVEADALAITIGEDFAEEDPELEEVFRDALDLEASAQINREFCTQFLTKVVQTMGFIRNSNEIPKHRLPPSNF